MARHGLVKGLSGLGVCAVVFSGAVTPARAGANLVFSSSSVDFGNVVVDTSVERSVTLTNTGDEPFTPFRFDLSDFNGPVQVQIAKSTCARNTVIPAGGSCVLVLYAFPSTLSGSLDGSLWVVDNTQTRAATLSISGAVVSPPAPPDNPKRASRVVIAGNRTEISWSPVADATGYEVQSSGPFVCIAPAGQTTCIAQKAFGQRVGVWVMARNDFGASDGVQATYRAPDAPVMFVTVAFNGRSASLNKAARAEVLDAGKALAKQGFSKDITVVAGTRPGRSLAWSRAQTVRSIILARYAAFPDIEAPSVGTVLRGRGNGVKVTVG